jgi:biopolymer transport protein ExbD
LLVFFVFTHDPLEVVAHLNADQPAATDEIATPSPFLRLQVLRDGYRLENRVLDGNGLSSLLARLARNTPQQRIRVESAPAAAHGRLVAALDLLEREGLRNVYVGRFRP